MKNSLLINNFVQERPKTAVVKHETKRNARPATVSANKHRNRETRDRSSSRQSFDVQTPRDGSCRNPNKFKPKFTQDKIQNSWAENLDSDEDISVSDLEDDYVDETFGNKANNYWATLDDSIKKINDDSDKYALKPRPNFKSSDDFKGVMSEMSGNIEYGVSKGYTLLKAQISRLTNITSLTAEALNAASQSENKVEEDDENEDKQDGSDESDDELKATMDREIKEKELVSSVGGAKRAWRVLKTHVKETGVENRTASVKMNWEALRHHVSGITDLDKARQDLYQRYGFLPTVQEDGTKVCRNVMWLNRTRAHIMQNQTQDLMRGNLRSQSARPFTAHASNRLRSISGNTSNNGSTESSNGVRKNLRPFSERPRTARVRLRPSSVHPKNL